MNWCDAFCLNSFFFSLTDKGFFYLLLLLWVFSLCLDVVHEAGHYYAAKLCGIDVVEFSIGKGVVIFRERATPSLFVLRAFPFGGRVEYGDNYLDASNLEKAFISSAGWLAEVMIGIVVYIMTFLMGANNPISTILFIFIGFVLIFNISPLTSDGRKVLRYLWLSIKPVY